MKYKTCCAAFLGSIDQILKEDLVDDRKVSEIKRAIYNYDFIKKVREDEKSI